MKHFKDQVLAGKWDEVEKYLGGFTKVGDSRNSTKIFFEIRKQKYLEALDRNDSAKAVEILRKDFKVFASFKGEILVEITQLLILEDFRQHESLSKYGDTESARSKLMLDIEKLIRANPLFRDKLTFPEFEASRLQTLIRERNSLVWQHLLYKNLRPNRDIKTLSTDHTCAPTKGAIPPPLPNGPLVRRVPKPGPVPQLGAHSPGVSPSPRALVGWKTNPNTLIPHAAVAQGPPGLVQPPTTVDSLKRPSTSASATDLDYQTAVHLMKRMRPSQRDDVLFSGATHPPKIYSQDDLPKTVVSTVNQGSNVMSLDFHPQLQTFLLVGTNVGDIGIWEVGSRERVAHRSFKVWNAQSFPVPLQVALLKDAAVSVNRCLWSPDGSVVGIAFSKHLIQTYAYIPSGELKQGLEIDAHIGGVNDIAFSHPNKSLSIVTCGDDRTIKVWDATTGQKQYVLEGHEAPVYSVCPHWKNAIQFILSIAADGRIKVWLYDCARSRIDYDAPGFWCTTMAYSADGSRLFLCGTSKDGDFHLVEWGETEGAIKRTYSGFRKPSLGVVQFDTTKNRFLAAGDDFMIKFWDMDSTNLLTTTDAEGGLTTSPRLRFNSEGSLLAVTTNDNGIKILANNDGQRLLRMPESRSLEGSRSPSQQINSKGPIINALGSVSNVSNPVAAILVHPDKIQTAVSMSSLIDTENNRGIDIRPGIADDSDKPKSWKLADIVDAANVKALRLPESMTATNKVVRLLYTNSGTAVLSLASNAIHKLWKWQQTERNPQGKSTASLVPQLWQPANGILMTNDKSGSNPEESNSCIALSKNDSYVMSGSGGKVSLFNTMNFKVMTTLMPPPPAATFLAFHPQDNNIVAIGMEDSSIQIYNVRIDEVKTKLKGHQGRITGLAFSSSLNVLVSSGVDAQLCVWSTDGWEKQRSKLVEPGYGIEAPLIGETRVQFRNDEKHILVTHESQLSIYDRRLKSLRTWSPRGSLCALISNAVYSCDGMLVYAGFCDGAVGVFDADSLGLRCRISPSAYISPSPSSAEAAHPTVIAAHPSEPNQIALGMSDGVVYVLEPSDAEMKWGDLLPQENGESQPSMSFDP